MGRPYDGHAHGDLGVASDGREFFMTWEIYHPSGNLYIGYRWLPGPATGVGDPTYIRPIEWGNGGEHISCQGPPGRCLVTARSDPSNGWQPFELELFLLSLDGSVLRLAHHRSSSCGYWAQPRATLSQDGTLILYASDWGIQPCRDPDRLGNPDPYLLFVDASPGGSCLGTGSFHIKGKVKRARRPLSDATLTLSGPDDCTDTTTTNGRGKYQFPTLGDGTYTVTPSKDGCTFDPPSRTVTISRGNVKATFKGTCR